MDYQTILYGVDNGLAKITFNRPEAGHAINREFAHEFMDVATRATTDPAVRCILISATGKAYGFGGDLKFFATEMDTIEATLIELTAVVSAWRCSAILCWRRTRLNLSWLIPMPVCPRMAVPPTTCPA